MLLRFSYNVFENYGNMSSPSVLFVLRDILDNGSPDQVRKECSSHSVPVSPPSRHSLNLSRTKVVQGALLYANSGQTGFLPQREIPAELGLYPMVQVHRVLYSS